MPIETPSDTDLSLASGLVSRHHMVLMISAQALEPGTSCGLGRSSVKVNETPKAGPGRQATAMIRIAFRRDAFIIGARGGR